MDIDENALIEGITEVVKMVIKQGISGNVSSKAALLTNELQTIISNAADAAASKVLDETRIEEIAQAAKDGATYTAIQQLISEVGNYAIAEATPIAKQAIDVFSKILLKAMEKAIREIVNEEVNIRTNELKQGKS
jgi:hypothetical protein